MEVMSKLITIKDLLERVHNSLNEMEVELRKFNNQIGADSLTRESAMQYCLKLEKQKDSMKARIRKIRIMRNEYEK